MNYTAFFYFIFIFLLHFVFSQDSSTLCCTSVVVHLCFVHCCWKTNPLTLMLHRPVLFWQELSLNMFVYFLPLKITNTKVAIRAPRSNYTWKSTFSCNYVIKIILYALFMYYNIHFDALLPLTRVTVDFLSYLAWISWCQHIWIGSLESNLMSLKGHVFGEWNVAIS